jgi:hypothetical protein
VEVTSYDKIQAHERKMMKEKNHYIALVASVLEDKTEIVIEKIPTKFAVFPRIPALTLANKICHFVLTLTSILTRIVGAIINVLN